ncbi:MAG: putative sugar transferase [Desulfacinum sp.]|nr:putative sugar transferase [Desulfacinum sp.]
MRINARIFYSGKGYGRFDRISKTLVATLNPLLALFFIVIGLPIFLLLAAIIKLKDGGPVLYKGVRLGKDKKPFIMYKFRTLPVGIEKRLGGKLFSYKVQGLPAWARFLRETRLDELPQLFNILKRDMDFIGPRPVRPVVYEEQCKHIPNYDMRFQVKPGLVGYSQLFTPHSTPKRLRAMVDNRLLRLNYSILFHFYLVGIAIFMACAKVLKYSAKFLNELYDVHISHRYQRRRALERIIPRGIQAFIYADEEKKSLLAVGQVADANDQHMRVLSNTQLTPNDYYITLLVQVEARHPKVIDLLGELWRFYRTSKERCQYAYVIKYKATSSFNQYLLDQYVLSKSLFTWYETKIT